MKKILKDLGIALCIAVATFFLVYTLKGSVLTSDLYNQGIDFLHYFRNHFNIFDGSYLYNWNIALGDNMYNLMIYYLMSPFNIILKVMKGIPIEFAVTIFITIKITFMIYFASLYFERMTSKSYKWIGAMIYFSTYNIMVYGTYQVMWLDTFIFLPLLLLAMENILDNHGRNMYIIILVLFITSDFYLAILMIPHIGIYGLIRYMMRNGKKGLMSYLFKMIRYSLAGILISSFVLVPAIISILFSAKGSSGDMKFGYDISNLIYFFQKNYVGVLYSKSNTYLSLIGMLVFIPFILFGKNIKQKYYYVHISILLFALFSDGFNYLLNFRYLPAGGDYRYNAFFNIYIAIILFYALEELRDNRRLRRAVFVVAIINIVLLLTNFNFNSIFIGEKNSKDILMTIAVIGCNILIISAYVLIICLSSKLKKRNVTVAVSIVLLIELMLSINFLYSTRNTIKHNVRSSYSDVLEYVSNKYGNDSRVELKDTPWSWNIYMANNINGVSGYHSLINGNYESIGRVLGTTNRDTIRNEFKGRNIIAQLVGTKYYITKYKFCPYVNSKLIDQYDEYYIYELDNKFIKFFEDDSLIEYIGATPSLVNKDIMLYSKLLSSDKSRDYATFKVDEFISSNYKYEKIESKSVEIDESGEYYVVSPKVEEGGDINSLEFKVNSIRVPKDSRFKNILIDRIDYNENYIGYLNKGDALSIESPLPENSYLVYISDKYVRDSLDNMNSIEINYIDKTNNGLSSEFVMPKDGYAFFPVVDDENWEYRIDNQVLEPIVVNGGFIAFELQEGTHSINMTYKFDIFYIGILISIVSIILFLIVPYVYKKRVS